MQSRVGRGDIPDGHGWRLPPGDRFLVIGPGASAALVADNRLMVDSGAWTVGHVGPTYECLVLPLIERWLVGR